MKKLIFCLAILFSLSTIAYAQVEPGRPGRYEMNRAFIHVVNEEPYWCAAYLNYPNGNVEDIGNQPESDPKIKFIKVVNNKNQVKVICKFTDASLPYETNAEVGDIIVDEDISGCVYHTFYDNCHCEGGTGHITAAANLGGYDPNLNAYIGGTVTLNCTFNLDNCNSNCNF